MTVATSAKPKFAFEKRITLIHLGVAFFALFWAPCTGRCKRWNKWGLTCTFWYRGRKPITRG